MSNRLAELKDKLKRVATLGGTIVTIEKGVSRFRCQNKFHPAREPVYHIFTSRIKEVQCECGIIYKSASAESKK